MTISELLPTLFVIIAAAGLSAGMTRAIRPLLLRHALAKPNARSSHRIPTPQGAGIAVIAATMAAAAVVIAYLDIKIPIALFGATLLMATAGFADDVKPMPILPRLVLQVVAVGMVLFTTSHDLRIVPACPLWIERSLLVLAGLWFVNLVNFMDGLDWMTVAEVVPITGAMIMLGSLGRFPVPATIVAAALCGAIAGFAPFNRPVAKVFLGDVGSLPIGLLLGWSLLELIYRGQLTAALLLPLYYLSDATMTLLRRLTEREPFWTAHRSHFYQRATDNGFTVLRVVSEVFALNVGLSTLAILSAIAQSWIVNISCASIGGIAVASVLYRFSRQQ